MKKFNKVLIIGLDGATFDIIKPLADREELPNLSKLMKNGVYGELTSTLHPTTPQAWTTFMTGKGAGSHGIFDFIERIPDKYEIRFVNGSFKKAKSIWSILNDMGKKVGVMNVPFTYPPEKVNGFMISGFDAPSVDSNFTYPPGLYSEILREVGRYDLRGTFPIGKRKADYKIEDIDRVIRNRVDVSKYLLRSKEWNLFMVVFGSTDHVQHLFWRHMEEMGEGIRNNEVEQYGYIIPHTYKKVDEAVGELLKEVGDDTIVIIMSDHGGGRIKKVINLNNWLAKNGLLKYKKKQPSKLLIDSVKTTIKRHLPRKYRDWIKDKFPNIKDKAESVSYFSEIDWEHTRAYSWGMYGNISINLKGRELKGTINKEDYERICKEIKEMLYEMKDPSMGYNIVEKVYMKEELYRGDYLNKAPDLVIQWRDYAYYTQGNLDRGDGDVFMDRLNIDSSDFEHTGTHRLHGILIMSGSSIRKGSIIHNAKLIDIAPTVFYLMGLPVPADMEGRILIEGISEEFIKENALSYSESHISDHEPSGDLSVYSEEDNKIISDKLKGLGYL